MRRQRFIGPRSKVGGAEIQPGRRMRRIWGDVCGAKGLRDTSVQGDDSLADATEMLPLVRDVSHRLPDNWDDMAANHIIISVESVRLGAEVYMALFPDVPCRAPKDDAHKLLPVVLPGIP